MKKRAKPSGGGERLKKKGSLIPTSRGERERLSCKWITEGGGRERIGFFRGGVLEGKQVERTSFIKMKIFGVGVSAMSGEGDSRLCDGLILLKKSGSAPGFGRAPKGDRWKTG